MRLNSRPTAQRALVSWLFSLLTLETLDSAAIFAGGLAAALMEEAETWLVHGGALAFVLAADTYFLLSCTFVTFSSTLLSFMRAHVVSLAWGLVVGAAVIDSGLTFDTRLFAPDFWDPTTLRLHSSDFVMSPKYFLASVMLVMFWDILLNDFHDLLDDDNSLTLSPLSLLRQLILFIAGKSGRGGGRGGALPGSNVVDIDALPPPSTIQT